MKERIIKDIKADIESNLACIRNECRQGETFKAYSAIRLTIKMLTELNLYEPEYVQRQLHVISMIISETSMHKQLNDVHAMYMMFGGDIN